MHEPVRTRDHTELALREFGADISVQRRVISLKGPARLAPRELVVPGDLSSSAFFLVAALLMPDSNLVISGVGLNPTRSSLLDFLVGMGANVRVLDVREELGEVVGEHCRSFRTRSGRRSRRPDGGRPN